MSIGWNSGSSRLDNLVASTTANTSCCVRRPCCFSAFSDSKAFGDGKAGPCQAGPLCAVRVSHRTVTPANMNAHGV